MARRYYSSTAQRTTLASPLSAGATTMIVASTSGFPGTRPYTLVIDPDGPSEEIVTVTAASGTTLTVVRGEDGTVATSHDLGATVWHGFTARDLSEPQAHIDADSAVHGVMGNVVGTTDAQTLSNKTMSGADNTFTDIPQSAVTGLTGDIASKAPINNPTFTGNVTLPPTTTLGDLSPTEISYLNDVQSNVQAQLNQKAPINNPTFTGSVTLPSDTTIGGISSTELAALDGVTGNIQSQISMITGGGVAVPPGGNTDDILVKLSNDDYDMAWRPASDFLYIPGSGGGNFVVPDGSITGGDTTGTYTVGAYTFRWHRFTTTGTTLSLTVTQPVIGQLLVVGGGGAAGTLSLTFGAGGGGAGSVWEGDYAFGTGVHNVIVGTGGVFLGTTGGNGGNTRFDDIICYGGGGGGSNSSAYGAGLAGGSGGGGGRAGFGGGAKTGGSLDGGATSRTDVFYGSAGQTGTGYGGGASGTGQAGRASSITGTAVTYGRGGDGNNSGGGTPSAGPGTDGLGDGGNAPTASGGSGCVIVRYRIV